MGGGGGLYMPPLYTWGLKGYVTGILVCVNSKIKTKYFSRKQNALENQDEYILALAIYRCTNEELT